LFSQGFLLDFKNKINIMKKPEQNKKKRLAAAKRGEKRSLRLKKTQAEKGARKTAFQFAKKEKERRYNEMINKVLQSRAGN